jgi:hypothetical protein
MKEFMLLLLNKAGEKSGMPPEEHSAFVKECEVYIGQLKAEGKLLSAQPLVREGKIISGSEGKWTESPLESGKEIQVGYYSKRIPVSCTLGSFTQRSFCFNLLRLLNHITSLRLCVFARDISEVKSW